MTGWTDERTELLQRLWRDGDTYEEISKALGVSRSAIAGKCRRMNLERGHRGKAAKKESHHARQA